MFVIVFPHGFYYSNTAHTKMDGVWRNLSTIEHAQLFKSRHQAEKAASHMNTDPSGSAYHGGRVVRVRIIPEE